MKLFMSGLALLCLLSGCASPPPLAHQIQEYERHSTIGLEKYAVGLLVQARNAFRQALVHAEMDDTSSRIASALLNLAACELLLDENESAGQLYALALREANLGQLNELVWQAQSGLAEATRRLGQADKSLQLYAARAASGYPIEAQRLWPSEISRALALADTGQLAAGLALLTKGEDVLHKTEQNTAVLASLYHARARLLLQKNDLTAALEAAQNALNIDRNLHYPPSVADDHYWLGKIQLARQETALAHEHLQRAERIYQRTGQKKRLAAVQQIRLNQTELFSPQ